MSRGVKWGAVSLIAALTLSAVAARADYDKGQAAWDASRHVEAVQEWRAAARANDARAMLALGRAFAKGLGVPQDFVEAHKWLNLAAGRGSAAAVAERDKLAAEMTAAERAEARKLARAWRPGGTGTATARPSAAPPKSVAAPARLGPPPARALKEAQTLLAALGYKPGTPDGKWGRRSIQAYQGFLRDVGMQPSDVLTPAALRAMRRMARGRQPAAVARPKPAGPAMPAGGLHRAVKTGNLDGLKAALKGKADVDALDARGWTPLMYAVNKGYALMVPPLLKAGAEINLRAPDGATALFIAALHGHATIVEHLMKAGADASIKGPKGRTAVDLAASTKNPDLVALFLSPKAKELGGKLGRDFSPKMVDGSGWTDLHYAAALNLPVLAKLLLAGGADPNARLKTDGKSLSGSPKQLLRQLGAFPTEQEYRRFGQTPLHIAGANYDVVKALVDGGADLNANRKYKNEISCCPPLYAVLSQEDTDVNSKVVKLLLANGADINALTPYGRTMLHNALTSSVAERLIALGADVNARDKDGDTPLHFVAWRSGLNPKFVPIAKVLIDHGADVNGRNKSDATPLISVDGRKGNDIYALLLTRGADPKAKDRKGKTALYNAIDEENAEAVKLLLRHGADVNARWRFSEQAFGYTPLYSAVIQADIEIVKILVENGADLTAKSQLLQSSKPRTPRQLAEDKAGDRNWSESQRRRVREVAELLGGHSGGQDEPEESHGD